MSSTPPTGHSAEPPPALPLPPSIADWLQELASDLRGILTMSPIIEGEALGRGFRINMDVTAGVVQERVGRVPASQK